MFTNPQKEFQKMQESKEAKEIMESVKSLEELKKAAQKDKIQEKPVELTIEQKVALQKCSIEFGEEVRNGRASLSKRS